MSTHDVFVARRKRGGMGGRTPWSTSSATGKPRNGTCGKGGQAAIDERDNPVDDFDTRPSLHTQRRIRGGPRKAPPSVPSPSGSSPPCSARNTFEVTGILPNHAAATRSGLEESIAWYAYHSAPLANSFADSTTDAALVGVVRL